VDCGEHRQAAGASAEALTRLLIGGKYRFLQVAKARLTVRAAKPSQTLEAAKAILTVSRSSCH
jgi:hypothetical protein